MNSAIHRQQRSYSVTDISQHAWWWYCVVTCTECPRVTQEMPGDGWGEKMLVKIDRVVIFVLYNFDRHFISELIYIVYVIIIIVSAAYKNQFQLLFFIATWNCQKITQAFYFFLGDFRAEFFSSRANWSFKVYIFTLHFHFLLFLIIWGVIITKAWLSFFWKFYLLMTICLIPLITISLIYLTEYHQILVKYQVEPCL